MKVPERLWRIQYKITSTCSICILFKSILFKGKGRHNYFYACFQKICHHVNFFLVQNDFTVHDHQAQARDLRKRHCLLQITSTCSNNLYSAFFSYSHSAVLRIWKQLNRATESRYFPRSTWDHIHITCTRKVHISISTRAAIQVYPTRLIEGNEDNQGDHIRQAVLNSHIQYRLTHAWMVIRFSCQSFSFQSTGQFTVSWLTRKAPIGMAVQCEGYVWLNPNHASFKESKSKRKVFKAENEFRWVQMSSENTTKMSMVPVNQIMEMESFSPWWPSRTLHTNQWNVPLPFHEILNERIDCIALWNHCSYISSS